MLQQKVTEAIPDNCMACARHTSGWVAGPEGKVYMPNAVLCPEIQHMAFDFVAIMRRMHKCPIKPEDRYDHDNNPVKEKAKK